MSDKDGFQWRKENVLITGTRLFTGASPDLARDVLNKTLDERVDADLHELVCGGAMGVDWWAMKWALRNEVTLHVVPARWKLYGKGAGPIRNTIMLADYRPKRVIGFWDGKSRGTQHMLKTALSAGVKITIVLITESDVTTLSSDNAEDLAYIESLLFRGDAK